MQASASAIRRTQNWHVTEVAKMEPPPWGIAVNNAGDVYIAQNSASRGRILFPNGKVKTVGKGFHGPIAIVPYKSLTYVANTGNGTVDRVLADGAIQPVGSGWVQPYGVAVDPSGSVYVLDNGASTVTRVKPKGKAMVVVPESLCNSADIFGVSVDEHKNVYVSCHASGKVFKVAPDGSTTALCSGWSYPTTIANDGQGNIYVENDGGAYISECTASGKLTQIQPDERTGPMFGIAYHDGALYVAATGMHAILKLTRAKQ